MQTLQIENEIAAANSIAQDIAVSNKPDLDRVTVVGKRIKEMIEHIEGELNPDIDKAHKLHKSLVAQREKYLKPLQAIVAQIKANIDGYRKRIEAEQRELERLANEALAREAEKIKKELETKAEESTNEWDAEVLKDKASQIQAVTVDTQKGVEGVSAAKRWKARVIDASLVPDIYKIVNEKLLNEIATETKSRHPMIPGVVFEQVTSIRL